MKPPLTVVETAVVALVPVAADMDVGETDSEKSGDEADVTVNETGVACVLPPPVPVTVMV